MSIRSILQKGAITGLAVLTLGQAARAGPAGAISTCEERVNGLKYALEQNLPSDTLREWLTTPWIWDAKPDMYDADQFDVTGKTQEVNLESSAPVKMEDCYDGCAPRLQDMARAINAGNVGLAGEIGAQFDCSDPTYLWMQTTTAPEPSPRPEPAPTPQPEPAPQSRRQSAQVEQRPASKSTLSQRPARTSQSPASTAYVASGGLPHPNMDVRDIPETQLESILNGPAYDHIVQQLAGITKLDQVARELGKSFDPYALKGQIDVATPGGFYVAVEERMKEDGRYVRASSPEAAASRARARDLIPRFGHVADNVLLLHPEDKPVENAFGGIRNRMRQLAGLVKDLDHEHPHLGNLGYEGEHRFAEMYTQLGEAILLDWVNQLYSSPNELLGELKALEDVKPTRNVYNPSRNSEPTREDRETIHGFLLGYIGSNIAQLGNNLFSDEYHPSSVHANSRQQVLNTPGVHAPSMRPLMQRRNDGIGLYESLVLGGRPPEHVEAAAYMSDVRTLLNAAK